MPIPIEFIPIATVIGYFGETDETPADVAEMHAEWDRQEDQARAALEAIGFSNVYLRTFEYVNHGFIRVPKLRPSVRARFGSEWYVLASANCECKDGSEDRDPMNLWCHAFQSAEYLAALRDEFTPKWVQRLRPYLSENLAIRLGDEYAKEMRLRRA
jgi:hypothetical protein